MNYVGTLSEAFMNDVLYIPNSELVYLSDDDKITAKLCNKLLYQSAESYGILDRKHTKEQEDLVKSAYFDRVDYIILRNSDRRKKVLNELCRRLDKFISRIEKKYNGAKGQELMKSMIKTIKNNPKDYLIKLDKEFSDDVKIFDSISSLNRTFTYFDNLYERFGLQVPRTKPIMDKYVNHPVVNYFLKATTGINLDSRRKIEEIEKKENQTDITMEM